MTSASCPHCGGPVPAGAPDAPYCCRGCEAAHAFLSGAGLARYYDLQGTSGVPVGEARTEVPAFLDELWRRAGDTPAPDGTRTVSFAFAGIHCAACVWVIDALFKRAPGARHLALNPVRGSARLVVDERFDLAAFVRDIGQLGYRPVPLDDERAHASDGLLLRMGITAALAMNVMMLSLAFYLGLEDEGGALARVFLFVTLALSTVALVVGGPVFLRGAWAGLKRGVAPLDLPIALGMILAWAGSVVSALVVEGRSAYFDTVTVFIALMVAGRFIQTRAVEKNRRLLDSDAGAARLQATRVHDDGRLEAIPVTAIAEGHVLLVAPGEIVPVNVELLDDAAAISRAFITGEPGEAFVPKGQGVEAGAKNEGPQALRVRAAQAYGASLLVKLLRDADEPDEVARTSPFITTLSRVYVGLVFALAALALVVWLPRDPARALDVVVAILVVTCPCALGLAAPLSLEMGLRALRGLGVFVRRGSALHRLLDVRAVLFDKTGTLSLVAPVLADKGALGALDDDDTALLAQLCARTRHPKSRAILEALPAVTLDPRVVVEEIAGVGVTGRTPDGRVMTLTRGATPGAVAVVVDEVPKVELTFAERPRPDARQELARLRARGLALGVLSGDDAPRVRAFAHALGLRDDEIEGGLTPDEKAARVAARASERPLYVGDGINDTLALEAAHVAATPAAMHPAVSARADLFTLADGVMPLAAILDVAARVRLVQRRNVAFSFAYNAVVLAIALSGHMSPLAAAVLMPLSGVATILHTIVALRAPRASVSSTMMAPAPVEVA